MWPLGGCRSGSPCNTKMCHCTFKGRERSTKRAVQSHSEPLSQHSAAAINGREFKWEDICTREKENGVKSLGGGYMRTVTPNGFKMKMLSQVSWGLENSHTPADVLTGFTFFHMIKEMSDKHKCVFSFVWASDLTGVLFLQGKPDLNPCSCSETRFLLDCKEQVI